MFVTEVIYNPRPTKLGHDTPVLGVVMISLLRRLCLSPGQYAVMVSEFHECLVSQQITIIYNNVTKNQTLIFDRDM